VYTAPANPVKLYAPVLSVVVLAVAGPESATVTPATKGPVTVPEMVQFVEQFTAVTESVNACVAFDPTPLLAVSVTGFTDAEVAVPVIVAVPSLLSVNVTPPGSDPVMCIAGVGLPVAVTVNVPFTFAINVVLLALVIAGGVFTVIVTVD
jgi:hypothetical protein